MKRPLALLFSALTALTLCTGCSQGATPSAAGSDSGSASTSAESDYDYLQDKGTLVVGVTSFEPIDYQDSDGEWTGFDADLARAVGEKLGLDVEFQEIDWDSKFNELNARTIDVIWNGMTITDEVKANCSVTDAYATNGQVVVMAADRIGDYTTEDSLKDLTFAVEAGSAGAEVAEELGLNVTEVDSQASTLMEVASGTCDAAIIDSTMANAMTGEGTDYANLTSGLELTTELYGAGFRKGSDVTAKVNDILAELREDGTLQKLADTYKVSLADTATDSAAAAA